MIMKKILLTAVATFMLGTAMAQVTGLADVAKNNVNPRTPVAIDKSLDMKAQLRKPASFNHMKLVQNGKVQKMFEASKASITPVNLERRKASFNLGKKLDVSQLGEARPVFPFTMKETTPSNPLFSKRADINVQSITPYLHSEALSSRAPKRAAGEEDSGIQGFTTYVKYKATGMLSNSKATTSWRSRLGNYSYEGRDLTAMVNPLPSFNAQLSNVIAVSAIRHDTLYIPAQPIAVVTNEDGSQSYVWLFNPDAEDYNIVMKIDDKYNITTEEPLSLMYGYFPSSEEIRYEDFEGYVKYLQSITYAISESDDDINEIDPGFPNFTAMYKYTGSGVDGQDNSQDVWSSYLGVYDDGKEAFECFVDPLPLAGELANYADYIPLAAHKENGIITIPAQLIAEMYGYYIYAFSATSDDGSIVMQIDEEGNITTSRGEEIIYGAFVTDEFILDQSHFAGWLSLYSNVKYNQGDEPAPDEPVDGKLEIIEEYQGTGKDASTSSTVNWTMSKAVYTSSTDTLQCLIDVIPCPNPDALGSVPVLYREVGDTIFIDPQPVFSSSQWMAFILDGNSSDAVIRLVKNPNGSLTSMGAIIYGAFSTDEFDPTFETYLGAVEIIEAAKYRAPGSHFKPTALYEPAGLNLFVGFSPTFYAYNNIMQMVPSYSEVKYKNFTQDLITSSEWSVDMMKYNTDSYEYTKIGEQVSTDKDFTLKTEGQDIFGPVTLVTYDGPEASDPFQFGLTTGEHDTEYILSGVDGSTYVVSDGTQAQLTKACPDNDIVYMTPLATHDYNISIDDGVIDDLIVYQGKPEAPLYTEGITFWVGQPYKYYEAGCDTTAIDAENARLEAAWISGNLISDDFRLTCEIRKATRTDDGRISLGDLIATATAKRKDFVTYSNGTGLISFNNFYVYDTDGLTISKDHLFLEDEFAVVFKDWSTTNTFDCIPISERETPANSITSNFFTLKGLDYEPGKIYSFSSMFNHLYVGFKNACYGYLYTEDPKRIVMGGQGGSASLNVHPMLNKRDAMGAIVTDLTLDEDYELPSWVSYSISDEAYSTPEDYNFNITFNVEALPDDVQYRTCDLKFWQKGAYMLIKVAQSADSGAPEYDGIETLTVSPATASDLRHNIAGQKVSKDFKGIIISNNKKFVNK